MLLSWILPSKNEFSYSFRTWEWEWEKRREEEFSRESKECSALPVWF
jgi:hypothetical protein